MKNEVAIGRIKSLKQAGYSVRDIAEEVKMPKSTVYDYMQKLSKNGDSTADDKSHRSSADVNKNQIFSSSIAQMTNSEQHYIDLVRAENMVFNDPEEGWMYHVTAEKLRSLGSGLWFIGVVYPDSAPKDWKSRLDATGYQWACSPLHDMDKWTHDNPEQDGIKDGELYHWSAGELYKAGDRKKSHWHIIVKVDISTSLRVINELIRPITKGPYLQVCKSLKGAFEYLTHMGQDPEVKYPYWREEEAEKHNGFLIEPNGYEKKIMYRDILKYIKTFQIETYGALTEHYLDSVEYTNIIATHTSAILAEINSMWAMNHPGDRKNVLLKELVFAIELMAGRPPIEEMEDHKSEVD